MVLNGGFESVKAFSAGNYSRRHKLKWLFEFLALLFLVLNQSTLFSLAGPPLRHFSRQLLAVFNSHIFVFLVFHAMLFLVYSLSHFTDTKPGSNRTDLLEGLAPARDEISVPGEKNTLPASLATPVNEEITPPPPVSGEKILVIGVSIDTTTPPPMSPERPYRGTKSERFEAIIIPPPPVDEISAAGEKIPVIGVTIDAATPAAIPPVRHSTVVSESEIRPYRRSESERFEANRERGKLRRSKTAVDGGEPARLVNTVDEMDIDDFNRTVESFIAEQKLHIGGRISG